MLFDQSLSPVGPLLTFNDREEELSIILSTRLFTTQQETSFPFRTLLYRYSPQQRVSDADAADLAA
jgi:hypothetical protein